MSLPGPPGVVVEKARKKSSDHDKHVINGITVCKQLSIVDNGAQKRVNESFLLYIFFLICCKSAIKSRPINVLHDNKVGNFV